MRGRRIARWPIACRSAIEGDVEEDLAQLHLKEAIEDERAVAGGDTFKEGDASRVAGLGGKERCHHDARVKQERFRRRPVGFLEAKDGTG